MSFQWVRRLTSRSPQPVATQALVQPEAAVAPSVLRYPPADNGLQLVSVGAIMSANDDLVTRLRLHAAMPEEQFASRFLAPLHRLASHINVLPATATDLFSGEMGLFRAALETGFFAFQASDGRIFTGDEGVERRHTLETRWRYLCFLAGMFYPLGRPLERIAVAGPDGTVWKRHFHGLSDWAAAINTDRVFVSWGSQDQKDEIGPGNAGLIVLPAIVGSENLQMLEDGATDLVASLYELAAGEAGTSRIAHQVVTGCWERIARREAARRPQSFGRVVSGTHQGPYLVGAVRALVAQGKWVPNKSVLKADMDGLYLLWPDAAEDLIHFGRDKGYPGWPHDAQTLAALLKAGNVVHDAGTDMGTVEVIDEAGEIRQALKVANPLAILEDFDPATYAGSPGKTLEAILEADPLSKAEGTSPVAAAQEPLTGVSRGEQKSQRRSRTSEKQAGDLPPTIDDTEEEASPASPVEPEAAQSISADSPPLAPVEAEGSGPLREAPEVRYADLVPEDLRSQIGNTLQVELLGKVVMAWRDKRENSEVMRRTDQGAAIALSFLTTIMRDAPTWVESMARAGLIFSPPQTPGLRIQKVAIPEGRNKVQAVVLSSLACKRLEL